MRPLLAMLAILTAAAAASAQYPPPPGTVAYMPQPALDCPLGTCPTQPAADITPSRAPEAPPSVRGKTGCATCPQAMQPTPATTPTTTVIEHRPRRLARSVLVLRPRVVQYRALRPRRAAATGPFPRLRGIFRRCFHCRR